ncbi:MAG: hypothetical protein AAGF91_05295 [Actinomycetota bacterium]
MTPTLLGRLQTRWVMVWTVGLAWLLIVGPWLPLAGPTTANVYENGLAALVLVAVVGTLWELVYHGLQQLRWDKDWPTVLGLVLGVSEGIVVYHLLLNGLPWDIGRISPLPFAWQFGSIWVAIWAVTNGPIRILVPRWRFAGGRFW